MINETIQSDEMTPPEYDMDAQEWAEFERDYARWCHEVELGLIQVVDNKDSRNV